MELAKIRLFFCLEVLFNRGMTLVMYQFKWIATKPVRVGLHFKFLIHGVCQGVPLVCS